MGWQEEELAKRARFQKDQQEWADMRKQTAELQSKKIKGFWEKLKRANSELPAQLRVDVTNDHNYEEVIGRYPNGMKLSSGKTKICSQAMNIRDNPSPIFEILFSTESGSFYGKCDDFCKQTKWVMYKIDDKSIDILLRNLCTGKELWTGLQVKPDNPEPKLYNPASKPQKSPGLMDLVKRLFS